MKFKLHPPAAVVSGSVLISFSGVFVKLLSAGTGPVSAAFYRVLLGGILLAVLGTLRRHRFFAGWKPLLCAAAAGLIFALDLTFWHQSILYIGPGLATILGNFQAVLMAATGILIFHEKVSLRLLLSIPLALTGLWLLAGTGFSTANGDYRTGIIFGLVTALCYTTYLLILRTAGKLKQRLSPVMNIAQVCLFAAFFLGWLLPLHGEKLLPGAASDWAILLAYGIFSQGAGWVLISTYMPELPASRTGILLLAQPALSMVWDLLFFGRILTEAEWAGALLALTAIYLGGTAGLRKNKAG